jgi:plastocyanin
MSGPLMRGALLAAVAALVALPVAGAAGGVPVTKKVTVGDDYYGPTHLTVKKNTTIDWVWLDDNNDSHDVKLEKGPKHAAKFHSASAASDFTFKEKLKVVGSYHIICTLHQDMVMTITVN